MLRNWWHHSRKALRKDFVCKEIHFTLPLSFLFAFLQVSYAIYFYLTEGYENLEYNEDLENDQLLVSGVILGIFCIYAAELTCHDTEIENGSMQKRGLLCGLAIVLVDGYFGIYELFVNGPISMAFFASFFLFNITTITIYFIFFHGIMIHIKREFYYKIFILLHSITFLLIGLNISKPGNSIVFWIFLAYLNVLCSHSVADAVLLMNDILRNNPIEEEEEEPPKFGMLDPSKLMKTDAYRDLSVDNIFSLPQKKKNKKKKD
ncbi:unnamed protein product [Caenorhabditis brenneri]